VDSSKDGGECWEVVGNDTLNSISSLLSTMNSIVPMSRILSVLLPSDVRVSM